MKSTGTFSSKIDKLKDALDSAQAIVIGAGAGLSTAAGFAYDGDRFERYFSEFSKKYGFSDMYSGGFYPYPTLEEYWAFWSRQIHVNRYMDAPRPVYQWLLNLARGRNYFVLTTNVDHCFQKAGFNKERLFYTQGDFGLFQCSGPCRQETFDNEKIIKAMLAAEKDLRVPSELVPHCPYCGRPMTTNLRIDNSFVQDRGWYAASARYSDFLKAHAGMKILFLELGVGYNTPAIIKFPFWKMTRENQKATYACINTEDPGCPEDLAERSICISADIGAVLGELGLK